MSKNNFSNTIIVSLLSSVNRKTFNNLVKKYNTDYKCRHFSTWEHFITVLIGQFTNSNSLRDIEEVIKFNSVEYYHLNIKKDVCRSTLSDANKKRDWRIFRDLFLYLISGIQQKDILDGKEVINLIDSTPIRINEDWCEKTLRIKGLKVHTIYNLNNSMPIYFDITGAKTEDITQAKKMINKSNIKENDTYIFDRGYISSEWWSIINNSKAFFITRNFKHFSYEVLDVLYDISNNAMDNNSDSSVNNDNDSNKNNNIKDNSNLNNTNNINNDNINNDNINNNNINNNNINNDNINNNNINNNNINNNNINNDLINSLPDGEIIQDCIIQAKGDKFKKFYKDKLRLVIVKRDRNKHSTDLKIYTNDFNRTTKEIAQLYKDRWQIELFFKWIKQNLKIKKFLSKNENGIKIQICICMIAYVLIKLAQLLNKISKKASIKSLIRIIKSGIFTRLNRKSAKIKVNKIFKNNPNQLEFDFMKSG